MLEEEKRLEKTAGAFPRGAQQPCPAVYLSPGPSGTQEVSFVSSENELLNYERNFPNFPDFLHDFGLSSYLGKVLLGLQGTLQCEMLEPMEGNVKAVVKPDKLQTN